MYSLIVAMLWLLTIEVLPFLCSRPYWMTADLKFLLDTDPIENTVSEFLLTFY
jgi:hypothetical protein